jgi:hypothetical protein
MKKLEGGSKFVGVTLDKKSADLLYALAKKYERTLSGQIRWMLTQENAKEEQSAQAEYAWKAE